MIPSFSLVIPTLNEEKYLPLLLQDLADQSFKNFEVIHVDGNSEDKTVEKAAEFKEKLDLKTIKTEKRNISHQRNLGGNEAHAQWILFLDADDRLPSYFLQGIRYQLDKYPHTDVFTTWTQPETKVLADSAIAQSLNLNLEVNYLIKNYCAFGALIGVRKSTFTSHKFDETTKAIEDSVFVNDLAKKGFVFKIFKEPKYTFSLRRIRKDGTLKSLRMGAMTQLRLVQGKRTFGAHIDYPMLGGNSYEREEKSDQNILATLSHLSKKQLRDLQKTLDKLNKFLIE